MNTVSSSRLRDALVLHLGHVCRHWRHVAHSSPLIWTHIDTVFLSKYTIPKLELWLRNSRTSPIDFITFLIEVSWNKKQTAILHRVYDLLLEHKSRWRNVLISIGGSPYLPFLDIEHGSLPELKTIHLMVTNLHEEGWCQSHIDTFWSKVLHPKHTNLERVEWGCSFPSSIPSHTPWQQLTHVNLSRVVTPSEFAQILPHCENMQALKVIRFKSEEATLEPSSFPAVISLLCLRTLSVGPTGDCDLSLLWSRIFAPSLTELGISIYNDGGHAVPYEGIYQMLTSSRCRLSYLSVSGRRSQEVTELVEFNERWSTRYFEAPFSETLERLEFHGTAYLPEQVIRALTPQTDQTDILPFSKLKVLAFDVLCPTDGLLTLMMKNRVAVAAKRMTKGPLLNIRVSPLEAAAHPIDAPILNKYIELLKTAGADLGTVQDAISFD